MKIAHRLFAFSSALFVTSIAHGFSTSGFQNPYGVVVNSQTNFIYVSNLNGDPNARDDNGFISRLKGDGTMDQLKFIDGLSKDVVLNAPKGMAIMGNNLYVADIDRLHVFELAGGKFLFDINFGDLPVGHFYDVEVGPDESLYLTDSSSNIIYHIAVAKLHEVTTFASGAFLGSPRAVAWFPARQMFVVSSSESGQVIALDRAGKRQAVPAIFLKGPEGIAVDEDNYFYIASSALGGVYRAASNFGISSFALNVGQVTGMAYQKTGRGLIMAIFDTGVVQSVSIPAPSK